MSRKILLADDSLTIQKVVELTFMEGDYEVTSVGSGDDALDRLAQMQPDVVVADVHMPGADGFELCRATKERYPNVPVLLLVGTFEPFEESTAHESGADAHLKKPFDSQELLRLVEELLSARPAEVVAGQGLSGSETGEVEERVSEFDGDEVDEAFSVDEPSKSEQGVVVAPPEETAGAEIGMTFADEDVAEDSMTATPVGLTDEDVERIARRVVELIGDQTVREISWDVIPDLAEILIKDRIRELEGQVD